jgi:hypothetical protein
VRVLRSRIADLTADGSDSVAATLFDTPRSVKLTSSAAWISLVVPRSRYAVKTSSRSGHVTVQDLVVDPRARRHLELTAEGDISLT